MNRHTALLSIATLTIFLAATAAQTPPTGTQNSPAMEEVGCPARARRSATSFGKRSSSWRYQADELRAEQVLCRRD